MGDVGRATVAALSRANVPFSEVLRLAPGPVGPLGPYQVMVNLQDDRRPDRPGQRVSTETFPPTAPVAEFYFEVVHQEDGRAVLRCTVPEQDPYLEILDQLVENVSKQGMLR